MEPPPPFEPLLDAPAVARMLGMHPETVLRLARKGELPALRFTRSWRFRASDVSAWMAAKAYVPDLPDPPRP
jgi:excisionase family DNA binding protein